MASRFITEECLICKDVVTELRNLDRDPTVQVRGLEIHNDLLFIQYSGKDVVRCVLAYLVRTRIFRFSTSVLCSIFL